MGSESPSEVVELFPKSPSKPSSSEPSVSPVLVCSTSIISRYNVAESVVNAPGDESTPS